MSSQNKNFTMVYYYVPEDYDDAEVPNVFGINASQEEIRINHIKVNFPLEGDYHFRFKYKLNNTIVWIDLNSDDDKLPIFNGRIFIKATRISWTSSNQKKNEEKIDKKIYQENFDKQKVQPATAQYNSNPDMNVYKAQDFNLFAGNNVSQPQEIPQKNNNNNGSNLLDFENLDLNNDWKQSKNEKKNDDLLDF